MARSGHQSFALSILGLCAIIALHSVHILDGVEHAIVIGLQPVLERVIALRVLALDAASQNNPEVDSLQQRIGELEKIISQCVDTQNENTALKGMIAYRDASKKQLIAARILGSATDPERSMLTIDKGEADGVKKGNAVIVNDGILVGTIAAVQSHTSSLLLLNDSRSKVIATFITDTQPHGIVEGQFQLGLKMNLIPIAEKIKKDTILMTSGNEQGIPSGLVIGRIADVQSKPTDLFQTALVTPSISYDGLQFVSIISMTTL
ncbi:MAG: rod shape-determining protein MreC [bacterium]|nr:rod shape-determining protein MreC [bacterium]